jgi:hypothetical protein
MIERRAFIRLVKRNIVGGAAAERWLRRLLCFFFASFCLLYPAVVVWGDYLLTLKSGLQIRASTYRTEGTIVHVWTESGSMSFPADVVNRITEIAPKPQTPPPSSQEENLDQSRQERTDEIRTDRKLESPLYVPEGRHSP